MILEIDMGNTRFKWRLCAADGVAVKSGLGFTNEFPTSEFFALQSVEEVRLACVAGQDRENQVTDIVMQQWGVAAKVAKTGTYLAGVSNSYQDPACMGVDRWLAMVAAYNIAEGACLIIDSGSSTTIDFVNKEGVHQGGFIVPGLAMMRSSLLDKTDRVRFDITSYRNKMDLGVDTAQAVEHGCLFMTVAAIEKACRYCQTVEPELAVFLCGGQAEMLAPHLSIAFETFPDLVMDGLRYTP